MKAYTHKQRHQTTPGNWADMIINKRLELKETQKKFGSRFGVSGASVSNWENGMAEAPYRVTWWLMHEGLQTVMDRLERRYGKK